MRMPSFAALLLALCAVSGAAACTQKPPSADPAETPAKPRAKVIGEIPTLATARQTDTTGGADAERQTWRVEWPFDSVTAYYRRLLPTMGWAIMNDQPDVAAGQLDLYSRKGSAALWMHFQRIAPTTTEWTIIGADSASATAPTPVKVKP